MLNIVLLEPEIPANTGNIARTCAATGTRLHLIEPLGFDISDKAVKRAGLDYWHLVEVITYKNLDEFREKNPDARCWYATTKAKKTYAEADFRDGDYLFFGKETRGLPESLIEANMETAIRIPIRAEARSLNLGNSAAVVVFEALRRLDFPHLKREGELTGRGD